MNIKNYMGFWFKLNKKEIITESYNSVFKIPWSKLKNVRLIIFDVDDTISSHKGEIKRNIIDLFLELQKENFEIVLLSNCSKDRGEYLNETFSNLNIYIKVNSDKPNPKSYKDILKKFKLKPHNCLVIGERVATDLYGAFLAGIPNRVLVKPFSLIFGGNKAGVVYRSFRTIENWSSRNT